MLLSATRLPGADGQELTWIDLDACPKDSVLGINLVGQIVAGLLEFSGDREIRRHKEKEHGQEPPDVGSLRDERRRKLGRAAYYKMSYEECESEYKRLLEEQGPICAICGSTTPRKSPIEKAPNVWPMDHNHTTGAIRGLFVSVL